MLVPYSNTAGVTVPDPIDFVMIGCGPDGFIGKDAWLPNIHRTAMFNVHKVIPSRDPERAAEIGRRLRFKPGSVGTDIKQSLPSVLAVRPQVVVGLATETPQHAQHLLELMELGVRYIIVDKPIVDSFREFKEVMTKARETGTRIWVTFNHRYNEPVFVLRHLAVANEVLSFEAGFVQDWLMTDPGIRQSSWRLAKYGGLKDIGVHAADLASFVLCGKPLTVKKVGMNTFGKHGKECFDTGSAILKLATARGDIDGQVAFSQASPGFADDIYIILRFKDRAVMWSMERNPDALFVSDNPEAGRHDSSWAPHLRGHGAIWKEAGDAAGLLSLQPPGHTQGWSEMWVHMFWSIAGDYLRATKLPGWESLPPKLSLPPPRSEDAGLYSMQFIESCMYAYETGCPFVGCEVYQY